MKILANHHLLSIVFQHSESFAPLYILVLVLAVFIVLYSGLSRKFPASTWVTVAAFIFFVFLFGLELFPYSGKAWISLIQGEQEPIHSKSLAGGVLFLILGILFIKYFLKIKPSIFDPIILILPFLGIVQRINCLFSGCCYGKPTGLPWAIQYSRGSSAWIHHVNARLISPDDFLSLGVHPTQIYTILALLLITLIILKTRHFWKVPGNLSIFAITLFGIQRFLIEFFREQLSDSWYSIQYLGMNGIQWIILILLPVFTSMLIIREKHGKFNTPVPEIPSENLPRNAFIVLLMVFITWNAGRFIGNIELLLVQCVITLAFVVNAIRIAMVYTSPSLRYPGLLALLATFLLTGQQNVETKSDTSKVKKNNGWFSIGGTYGGGSYDEVLYNCNGNETGRIPHSYNISSLGFAYHLKPKEYQHLMIGLNYFYFYDRTKNSMSVLSSDSYNFSGINPYVNLDFHNWGLGLGGAFDYNVKGSNTLLSPHLPSGYFRLGPKELFFVHADFMYGFHMSGMAEVWKLGAGSGFGNYEKHQLMGGITTINDDKNISFFMSGNILLNKNFMLESSITAGNKLHGAIGLQYHFGANRWNPIRGSNIFNRNQLRSE